MDLFTASLSVPLPHLLAGLAITFGVGLLIGLMLGSKS
jgi:hypothetical protein